MKHQLTAKSDVSHRIGDRLLEAKSGETITLSPDGAEIAMNTGLFDYANESPETETEIERAKEAAKAEKQLAAESAKAERQIAALESAPKEKLVKKAAKLGIENAAKMKKSELVETLSDAPVVVETTTDASAAATHGSTTRTAVNPAPVTDAPNENSK